MCFPWLGFLRPVWGTMVGPPPPTARTTVAQWWGPLKVRLEGPPRPVPPAPGVRSRWGGRPGRGPGWRAGLRARPLCWPPFLSRPLSAQGPPPPWPLPQSPCGAGRASRPWVSVPEALGPSGSLSSGPGHGCCRRGLPGGCEDRVSEGTRGTPRRVCTLSVRLAVFTSVWLLVPSPWPRKERAPSGDRSLPPRGPVRPPGRLCCEGPRGCCVLISESLKHEKVDTFVCTKVSALHDLLAKIPQTFMTSDEGS